MAISETLQKRLDALRLEYVKSFAEEIRALVESMSSWSEKAHAELVARAHRLAGTAGSYGLEEVSRCAREVENLDVSAPERDAQRAVDTLCDALRSAMNESTAPINKSAPE